MQSMAGPEEGLANSKVPQLIGTYTEHSAKQTMQGTCHYKKLPTIYSGCQFSFLIILFSV